MVVTPAPAGGAPGDYDLRVTSSCRLDGRSGQVWDRILGIPGLWRIHTRNLQIFLSEDSGTSVAELGASGWAPEVLLAWQPIHTGAGGNENGNQPTGWGTNGERAAQTTWAH